MNANAMSLKDLEPSEICRGDVFVANLNPIVGSEQGGTRLVLIIQNDIGNKYSPTVIQAAITSRCKNDLATHVKLPKRGYSFLDKDSVILLEQIRTLDKSRLIQKVGKLKTGHLRKVNEALKVSLGLKHE